MILFLLPAALFADVKVNARFSSPEAGTEDLVDFSITVEGASSDVDIPRLPDVPDFKIYGGPFTSTSVSMINFNVTRSVTYTWRLNPLKTGTLAIPAMSVKVGDKVYATPPQSLKVIQGSARSQQPARPTSPFDPFPQQEEPAGRSQGEVMVRVVPDKTTAYVGEPITLTYELLSQVSVNGLAMDKAPSYTGFWAEPVDLPRQPQGRPVEIGGKAFQAFAVRKDILFATAAGEKTIEESAFRLQVMVRTRDFFGFAQPQEVLRKSAPITLHILDLPPEKRPPGYAGAVGDFTVQASTDKVEVQEGEAFALRFTVKGKGNLKTLSPPVPPVLPDCRVYDPKSEEKLSVQEGVLSGSRTWEWIVVPQSRQLLSIPSIPFASFDIRKREYAQMSTAPLSVFVKAGQGSASAPVVIAGGEEVKTIGKDIAYIATEEAPLRRAASPLYVRWWFFVLLALPLVANLALLATQKQQAKWAAAGDELRIRKARGKAGKRLAKARKALKADPDGFHKLVRSGIVGWLADKSGRAEEGLTAQDMEQFLKSKQAPDDVKSQLQKVLAACDMARYAPGQETEAARERLFKDALDLLDRLEKLL